MSITKYLVHVAYDTVNGDDLTVYADSEEQAREIALIAWRETHTDKCINPRVLEIKEKKKP